MSATRAHVWEPVEITLHAAQTYANPYTEVELWVDLKGPGFAGRCYGFWDGDRTFRIRVLATAPGLWSWTSHATPVDPALDNQGGTFEATPWTEPEKELNPNRRGFVRPTSNGHALEYPDGTPFFYLADTWWSCSTWRYPWKGTPPAADYVPGPGMGFEEAVQFRRQQGYNGVALIAAYPSWQTAGPPRIVDADGTPLRQSWGVNQQCALMADESGNPPFAFPGKVKGFETIVPDFDRINPAYFQSLDRKMRYLSDQGMIPFFESIRRDQATAWRKYYAWPDSYLRFLQYLVARYGCFNQIFSGIHADTFGPGWLKGPEWNAVLTEHWRRYGPMPFVQLRSTNVSGSTFRQYGHRDTAPWLTLHGVGNEPRDHRVFPLMQEMFGLPNPLPMLDNEPFYPFSSNGQAANIKGDQAANTRACAYGSVLNGGLAGYVHGTQGYYLSGSEPRHGVHPYVWEALQEERFRTIAQQMTYLPRFLLSEGPSYRDLAPDRTSVYPSEAAPGLEQYHLDGWASAMRSHSGDLVLAYFEIGSVRASIRDLVAGARYAAMWFNPRSGEWLNRPTQPLEADATGAVQLPEFPSGGNVANEDWALKLKRLPAGHGRLPPP